MYVGVVSKALWIAVLLSALLVDGGRAQAQTATPTPGGDCCTIHDGPSCDDSACAECVCDIDPICCLEEWDDICISFVEDGGECAVECGCSRTPTPTPPPGGDCCSTHAGRGCDDSACQACVCGIDAQCCNLTWDAFCVSISTNECLGECPCVAPPTETPAPTPTPGGDCCAAHEGTSCDDQPCEDCVCALDPACCSVEWDPACAEQAAIECALECTECGAPGDCCSPHAGVSCDEARCKTCVCALDVVCCTEEWDQRCVDVANADCPIDCTCEVSGDCCAPHDGIGCMDTVCQDCVCALDPLCCTELWDERCVEEAAVDCAARCEGCTLPDDCCTAREDPGCAEASCEACVCNVDAFCCDELWDAGCVDIAEDDCPSECLCGDVPVCPGDCANDGEVTINELILCVNIALGAAGVEQCPAIDTSGDGDVTVNELIQAVNAALGGCPI